MCCLPCRGRRRLRRRGCGLPAGHMRDACHRVYCGCAQSSWPGSRTFRHLQSALPMAVRLGGLRLVAQSYVGKRPISKGIGRGIRRFVIVAFALPASGRQPQASAQGVGRLRTGAATRHGLRDVSILQLLGMSRRRRTNRNRAAGTISPR